MDTLHQAYHTVPVHTPRIRLIRQSQQTPPASDWSKSHGGHSQPQTNHTVSVDTLQPQTGQTVPVDILNLGLIIHIGLLTTSDWLNFHIGLPASYWGDSSSASYNLRLIRQSQRTQHNLRLINRPGGHTKTSDWSDIHSRHPTTSGWSITLDTLQTEADQKFTVGHPSIRPIRQLKWTPPSFSAYSMNNTIFMFELDSTRRSWSK